MKKYISLLFMVLFVNSLTYAQYRIYKTKYDRHTYKVQPGDPYNPTVTGIASFCIPGLGQMTAGETGRGLAFMLPWATPFLTYFFVSSTGNTNSKAFEVFGNDILPVYMVGVAVWSCIDGVRVAKVNNLAWRDRNKTSLNLHIDPFVDVLRDNPQGQLITGITLKYHF